MKKIGILNLQSSSNYGAVLQAYALSKVVESYGYDHEHIDLNFPRSFIINAVSKIIHGDNVFEVFRKQHIKRTTPKLWLTGRDSTKYDCIVVGSDQVWRPQYTNRQALNFFLKFCRKDVKRISYAASFGLDYWDKNVCDESKTNQIKQELDKFHAVSVRENSGVDICKNEFKINAEHVLDPTLLAGVDVFEHLLKSTKLDEYKNKVSYYKLDSDECFTTNVNRLSESINAKPFDMLGSDKLKLEQWMSAIKYSEVVLTDSFHGVCFCILFNKEFYCVINGDRGRARLESLLNVLGINNRLVDNLDNVEFGIEEIDYKTVNNKLSKLRKESEKFLFNALSYI